MKQHDLDALYHFYKLNGLKERCPADPGPERRDWHRKRMYLACRLFVDMMEREALDSVLSEAAACVGISARQPGWAALEGGFVEAMQEVFAEADKEELLESDMTHFSVGVSGRWDNEDKEFNGARNVTFSARLKKDDEEFS